MAASAFCRATADEVLANAEIIEDLPPWRLTRLELSLAAVVVALKHESSTDTDLLQRLGTKHVAVLEALLHDRAKYIPPERENT